MVSTSKQNNPSSSSTKPPKSQITLTSAAATSHPHVQTFNSGPATSSPITISLENLIPLCSSHLSRQEVLKRRFHFFKQLSRCYRDLYWVLMEELKTQYRDYYWEFGVSPFKEDNVEREGIEENRELGVNVEGSGENSHSNNYNNSVNNLSDFSIVNYQRCAFVGCKLKAMPLTSFCHLHILSDSTQKLYKACTYVIKSAQAGPIICGKPIMISTVPSLCNVHFLKAQNHINRALKRAGLNVSSPNRVAPKIHVLVADYIRQIQARRRSMQRVIKSEIVVKEEKTN